MGKIRNFIVLIILMFFRQMLFAQNKPVTYSNPKNAFYNKDTSNIVKDGPLKGLVFWEAKVNDITLKPDSTYEFWSRPNTSCFTWKEYKGIWKKQGDTVLFYSNYEVVERDVSVNYKTDQENTYQISFSTDRHSKLRSKEIKVQYVYDYDAHLDGLEKIIQLNNNKIEIPFHDIPNRDKLTAIRIECRLTDKSVRYSYLTQNEMVNIKKGDLPNIINVKFIESPQKETVYRIIKTLIQNGTLTVLSTTKSKIELPDYFGDIVFEDSYALSK